jgi:tetratricopeptide (TPR) repeat protein
LIIYVWYSCGVMKNLFGFFLVPMWERSAMNNFVLGRYAKAEEFFRKIQAVQPNKFALGHNLGLVCLAQERYEEAEGFFLRELELYGETYIRFKSLGDMYYIWGKREKCSEYYSKSLSLCEHEGDRRLISRRMTLCADPAAFETAMESYRELKRGNTLMAEKDFDGSYDAFKKAVDLDPYNFQALNNLGALEMNHKKDIPAAVKFFEKASALTSLQAIHNNLKRAQSMTVKEEKK